MRSSILSLAFLAGIAFGSPIVKRDDLATITDIVSITDLANLQPEPTATPGETTVTIHVYVYVFEPEPTPTPVPVVEVQDPTTTTAEAAPTTPPAQSPAQRPADTPAPPPPAPPPPPAASSPAPSPSYGNADSSTLGSINKWRSAYGLAPYQWSDSDASLAAQCGQDNKNNGVPVHSHYESGGQVIAPGTDAVVGDLHGLTPFELSLAAWLCEVPSDSQIGGLCDTLTTIGKAAGTLYTIGGPETGHHDAILSTDYKTVGCAYTPYTHADYPLWAGYWICNFGR